MRGTYATRGLGVVKQVENVIHEVILVRVLLVVQARLQSLLEDGYHVRSICCRNKLQRAINLFAELVAAVNSLFLHVNFVGDADAGDVGALVAHLCVPSPQVLVGHLACYVEHHDTHVRAEVVCRVQFVEGLLSRRVPNVYMPCTVKSRSSHLPTLYVLLLMA